MPLFAGLVKSGYRLVVPVAHGDTPYQIQWYDAQLCHGTHQVSRHDSLLVIAKELQLAVHQHEPREQVDNRGKAPVITLGKLDFFSHSAGLIQTELVSEFGTVGSDLVRKEGRLSRKSLRETSKALVEELFSCVLARRYDRVVRCGFHRDSSELAVFIEHGEELGHCHVLSSHEFENVLLQRR